jgi:molybdopterin converting factor small subunit
VAVTLRLPSIVQSQIARTLTIDEPLRDVAALFDWLNRVHPGLGAELADPIFNIAVNDEMLLHGVRAHPLHDGDVVEVVPSIAGG